jgi:hypothetical protein
MTQKISQDFSSPRAPFRFATLTSTPHGGRRKNTTTTTNNHLQSTKFISGLDRTFLVCWFLCCSFFHSYCLLPTPTGTDLPHPPAFRGATLQRATPKQSEGGSRRNARKPAGPGIVLRCPKALLSRSKILFIRPNPPTPPGTKTVQPPISLNSRILLVGT